MKTKKNKKLVLKKETIAQLSDDMQNNVKGGTMTGRCGMTVTLSTCNHMCVSRDPMCKDREKYET